MSKWQIGKSANLSQEIERWRQQAQERKVARTEAERQALWASHEQRLSRQRALIDELLQETAVSTDAVPSVSEIREVLGQQIRYEECLSDDIILMRYDEQ
jgi:hypothetical protein